MKIFLNIDIHEIITCNNNISSYQNLHSMSQISQVSGFKISLGCILSSINIHLQTHHRVSCIKSIVWNKDLILQHHILKHSINHLNYVSQIFSSRSSFVSKNSLQDINYRKMDMQFLMRLVILLIESNCPKYCGTIDITPHLLQITNISRNGNRMWASKI